MAWDCDTNEETVAVNIRIGEANIEIPISKFIYNAISQGCPQDTVLSAYSDISIALESGLRSLLPKNKRPVTDRQKSYIISISNTLDIELPQDIFTNTELCNAFIDENKESFNDISNRKKEALKQSNRVERWLSAVEFIKNDASLENAANAIGVKPFTIDKYLNEYSSWVSTTNKNDRQLIFAIIQYKKLGFDPYERSARFILDLPKTINSMYNKEKVRGKILSSCIQSFTDNLRMAITNKCISTFFKSSLKYNDDFALKIPKVHYIEIQNEIELWTEDTMIEFGWYEELSDICASLALTSAE